MLKISSITDQANNNFCPQIEMEKQDFVNLLRSIPVLSDASDVAMGPQSPHFDPPGFSLFGLNLSPFWMSLLLRKQTYLV